MALVAPASGLPGIPSAPPPALLPCGPWISEEPPRTSETPPAAPELLPPALFPGPWAEKSTPEFVDSVLFDRPPPQPVHENLRSLRATFAAYEAARTGAPVTLESFGNA